MLCMGSRYSLWVVVAGVVGGLIVGFLAGRGLFRGSESRNPQAFPHPYTEQP